MEFTRIKISDVRTIVLRLLDHVERDRGITSVQLSKSFYWHLDSEARFDMTRDPSEFDVGSLEDDWHFVSKLLDETSEPVSLQLEELASILEFIGRTVGE